MNICWTLISCSTALCGVLSNPAGSHMQEPYIVSKHGVHDGDAILTSYVLPNGGYVNSKSFNITRRENGRVLKNGQRYKITSGGGTFRQTEYFNSTLAIRDGNSRDAGNRYMCHVDVGVGLNMKTMRSEEYVLGTSSPPPSYKVARSGANVALSISCRKEPSSSRSPYGRVIFKTYHSMVYVPQENLSKIKIGGVLISSAKTTVHFVIHNTSDEDAGQYYCGMNSPGQSLIIFDLQNPYIVSQHHGKHDANLTCLAYLRIVPDASFLNISMTWRTSDTTIERQANLSVTSRSHQDWLSNGVTIRKEHTQFGDTFSCRVEVEHGLLSEWSEPYILNSNFSTKQSSTASVGHDLEIRWKQPPLRNTVQLIKNSFGQEIVVIEDVRIKVSSQYVARIRLGPIISFSKYDILSFTLYNITAAEAGTMTCYITSLLSTDNVSYSDGYLLVLFANQSGEQRTTTAGQMVATTIGTIIVTNIEPQDGYAFPVPIVTGVSVVSLVIVIGISLAVFIVPRRNAENPNTVYYNGRTYFV